MKVNYNKFGGLLAEVKKVTGKKVIQRARQTGTPVIVWEQGHVKEIPGEQFEITTAARHDMASHPFNGLLSK